MGLEQIGNPLLAGAQFTISKLGATGLNVLVDVWYWNLAAWSHIVTSSPAATEVAHGVYTYNLPANVVTGEGVYLFVFATSATSVDQREIVSDYQVGQGGLEDLDARISSRAGAGALVTYGGPVADNTDVTVVAGDDYLLVDSRQLVFTAATSGNVWPSFLSRIVQMTVVNSSGAIVLGPVTGVGSSSGNSPSVYFELSSSQTNLTPAQYAFDIQVSSTTGGHIATLVIADFNVVGGYTP